MSSRRGIPRIVIELVLIFVVVPLIIWANIALRPKHVPEYPTVTRVCVDGDDFSPIPVVIDGEQEILPCNDPITVYPKADR